MVTQSVTPSRRFALIPASVSFALLLLGLSCGGDGPVEPGNPPDITQLTAAPTDIMPGDSVLVTYKALRADSLVLHPPGTRMPSNDSDQVYIKPSLPTAYTMVAYNKDGVDSARFTITMSGAAAQISGFTASEPVIINGDSSILSWSTQRADSLVIDHGIGKVANPASGSVTVKPSATTVYRAIAYNIGTDTATVTVTVQNPASIQAQSGLFYKGNMGSSVLDPPLTFVVQDAAGGIVTKAWVHYSLVEGDGTLSADSSLPNGSGTYTLSYNFSGVLGHAIIRAKVPGVDSIDVYVRANTLIPGPGGQGQYVLLDSDQYYMVKNFNGEPERVDFVEQDGYPYNYVVYEQSFGVVIILEDDGDGVAENLEPVFGVIVNTTYDKTTAEGIGIGSHMSDVFAVYGPPDTSYLDPTPPPADVYIYSQRDNSSHPNMTFFASPDDSTVFEIHLIYTPSAGASLPRPRTSGPVSPSDLSERVHEYRLSPHMP